jgi:hypothetical protein
MSSASLPSMDEGSDGDPFDFKSNSDRFPKAIELQLPGHLVEWLRQTSETSGRCESELLLELIDRGLQNN